MISIKKYDYFSKLSNAYAEKTLGSPKGPILWPLDSNLLMCDYISMIDSDCCHIMYSPGLSNEGWNFEGFSSTFSFLC